ncbi:MAG: tetratricopeptide repeat protein [Solirubrobacterales bacterium]
MIDPLTHEDGCWQQDLASQHSDDRAEAQLQLGIHHAAQGQTEAAERAFAAVDPDDDRLAAARASLRLHRLLIATGQTVQAWDALATTNELSDPRRSPDVELELAARDAALGQRDEAARRYRAVLAARTHRDRLGALAAYRLGELQSEQGARDQATELWRLALQGADENLRPHVLVRLADALRGRPEDREAEGFYQQALASDHPDLAPRAALALASLLEQRDALSPALALYAIACASGDRDIAEMADLRRHGLMRRRTRAALDQAQRTGATTDDTSGPDDDRDAGWHPWRKVKLDWIRARRKAASKQPPSDSLDALQSIGLAFAKIIGFAGSGSICAEHLSDTQACFTRLLQEMDTVTIIGDDAASQIDYVIYHPQLSTAQDDEGIRTMLLSVQVKCDQRDWLCAAGCQEPPIKYNLNGTCIKPLLGGGQPRPPDERGALNHVLLLSYAQALGGTPQAGPLANEHSLKLTSGALAYGHLDCDATGQHDQRCRRDALYLLGGSHCCGNRSPKHPS